MLHAQHRNFKREFEHRTVTRILAIFSLIAASVLVFAIAPGSVSANVNRAERLNHRMRVPAAAAAAHATAPASFPLPFAPIDVDRTDDVAAASGIDDREMGAAGCAVAHPSRLRTGAIAETDETGLSRVGADVLEEQDRVEVAGDMHRIGWRRGADAKKICGEKDRPAAAERSELDLAGWPSVDD